jgi:pimeloyl-ACP methyl ester carboxylesterase
VISFKGSDTSNTSLPDRFINSENNLNVLPQIPIPYCIGCAGAGGFINAYSSVRSSVLSGLNAVQRSFPNFQIVVTGHSLGGALAQLCAADLRNQTKVVQLVSQVAFSSVILADERQYTYASPRVGNAAFANTLNAQDNDSCGNKNFRVAHGGDFVVDLPAMDFGYRHTHRFFNITTPLPSALPAPLPALQDIILVDAGKDIPFNTFINNTAVAAAGPNHVYYFNVISFCDAPPTSLPAVPLIF